MEANNYSSEHFLLTYELSSSVKTHGDGWQLFALFYQPHSTRVTVAGTEKRGGIFEISALPASGTQYLIDYDQKNAIFVSGASIVGLENNIPANGAAISALYDRKLPVIKYGSDRASVLAYGPRDKAIIDNNINDPLQARQLVISTLEQESQPKIQGTLEINGTAALTAGNTITVNLPNHNINSQTYTLLEVDYKFTRENELKDDVLKVKVNKKLQDVTNILKDILLQLRQLQAQENRAVWQR